MGVPQLPHPVRLFVGLLTHPSRLFHAEGILQEAWGPIEERSPSFPFTFSDYYRDELGSEIVRGFYSFEKWVDPEMIREFKIQSNRVEAEGSVRGLRQWNIDPGYLDLDKIVLVTTKPASYRIYLGKGIYAQSTLYFEDGTYRPWPWTYRDYRENITLEFFNQVRKNFKEHLSLKSQIVNRKS